MFSEGSQIGAYTIRRRLGAGGMGEVYLAEHRYLVGRKVAIKVLLPELSTNEEFVSRFFNEARAASRIEHPGIVEILDCDRHSSGRAYIVMELLEGESLGNRIQRQGGMDVRSALGITGEIARALGAAHQKGIIHRDLKPDNVFLVSRPGSDAPVKVKILDFGIAKLVSDGTSGPHNTRTGSMLGTPLYMSPEQCRGTGDVDYRTDIYSLGCILFELIAGRPPFVRAGAGELVAAHLSERAPELSHLESVPPGLDALVARMLEKDPDRRPQTMLDVVRELERHAGVGEAQFGTLIIPAPPVPAAQDVARAPAAPARPGSPLSGGTLAIDKNTTLGHTASEATGRRSALRPASNRAIPAFVGGAVVAIAAVIVLLATQSATKTDEPPAIEPPRREAIAPRAEATAPPPSSATSGEQRQVAPAAPQPVPSEVEVDLASTPSDAEVWVSGEAGARGRTPLKLRLSRTAGPTPVVLRAVGYSDHRLSVDPDGPSALSVELRRSAKDRRRIRPRPSQEERPSPATERPYRFLGTEQ